MFGLMIDIGPKFYAVPYPTPDPLLSLHDLKVKVMDLEFLCLKFYV